MENQEIFDTVVAHLRKQGCKSVKLAADGGPAYGIEGISCLYRGPNGLMCAAGCLIADEDYSPEMEDISANRGILQDYFEEMGCDTYFIRKLQIIHDEECVQDWEDEFERLAQRYGLVYTPQP